MLIGFDQLLLALIAAGLFLMFVWWFFKSGAIWYLLLFGVVLFLLFVFEPPLEDIFEKITLYLLGFYESFNNFFNNSSV